jgi:hypothetical protein
LLWFNFFTAAIHDCICWLGKEFVLCQPSVKYCITASCCTLVYSFCFSGSSVFRAWKTEEPEKQWITQCVLCWVFKIYSFRKPSNIILLLCECLLLSPNLKDIIRNLSAFRSYQQHHYRMKLQCFGDSLSEKTLLYI